MLESRTVDQASPIFPTDISSVDTSDLTNKVQPISGYHWIAVNTKVKPYDDVKVRQAIAHAIDRTEVCQLVWYGLAKPIDSPLMYFEPDYTPVKAPEYDPQTAMKLLADAGYPDGFSDTLTAVPITEDTKVATVAAAQLEKVGIHLTIETPELSTYLKIALHDKTYHIAECGNTDPPEPDYILSKFYETGGFLNMANYSNSDVDGLFKQAREEYDDTKRTALYAQIQEIVLPDAPYVWIENAKRIYAWWRDLQGYTPHSDLSQCFSTVWSPKLKGT
jgi:peptide/nickel transport system substrate-binding protein